MVQVNASARLKQVQTITAATAADAGKIVLWIEKATGTKGTAKGKAGRVESMIFKIKAGKDTITLGVTLDVAAGGLLLLEGKSRIAGELGNAEGSTGRQTILKFKDHLRNAIALQSHQETEVPDETIAVLKKLISAKSKVEA